MQAFLCQLAALIMPAADEAPLQLAAVQLSHCMWGLHAWGPRGSDPTAGEVTAADPVPPAAGLRSSQWADKLAAGYRSLPFVNKRTQTLLSP